MQLRPTYRSKPKCSYRFASLLNHFSQHLPINNQTPWDSFTNVGVAPPPPWINDVQSTGLARNPLKSSSPLECLCSTWGVQGSYRWGWLKFRWGRGTGCWKRNANFNGRHWKTVDGATSCFLLQVHWHHAPIVRTRSSRFRLVEFTFWWCKTSILER